MTVGEAFWPELLSAEERAVLRPGVPERLERAPAVLVVGGGMLGLCTAVACAEANLGSVVLLEQAHIGAGASGGAAGQLLPAAHVGVDPPFLVELMWHSLRLWHSLEQAIPGGVGLHDLPWLTLGDGVPADAVPGGESLTIAQVAQLVPGLATPTRGVLVRGQARVNPLQALARLAVTVPGLATGVHVAGITCHDGRLQTVSTSAGEFKPGNVIFATGNPPRVDGLDLDVPWSEVKGHMLVTEPLSVALPGTVTSIATTIDGRRLMIGGTLDVDDHEAVLRPAVIDNMRAELGRVWPPAAHVGIARQWACFRPAHPDRVPVVDRLSGVDNVWLTSGHYKTGILLAPATAEALATWVKTGQRPDSVAPLGLSRFGRT